MKFVRPAPRSFRRWRVVTVLAILTVLAWHPVEAHLRAASMLTRFSDPDAHGWIADVGRHPFESRDMTVSLARGTPPIPARIYVPLDRAHPPGLVLVHGVHWKGISDPRLQHFAETLAASGISVLTPEIAELADYRIDPASLLTIRTSVQWMARETGAPVGLLGLSFGGGLSLVVATDPEVLPSLRMVASVGAHDDLERVLRFFVTDSAPRPDGSVLHVHAHDYGTVVLEYSHVEDLFASEDVTAARDTLRFILHEDHDAAVKRAKDLSAAGAAKMKLVFDHDTAALAPALTQEIDRLRPNFAAVSPSAHLGNLRVPAYVLHGSGDTVIPPSEADWLAHDIPHGDLKAELVSRAIEHVHLEKGTALADELALLHFMSQLLDATMN